MRWNEFKDQLKKQAETEPSLNGSLTSLWHVSRQLSDLADCCTKQGQLEQAYVYHLRAANTLILYAPKHRDFASASASSKSEYKTLAVKNLERLEKLTAVLKEKWDAPTPEIESDVDQDDEEQTQEDVQHTATIHNSVPLYPVSDASAINPPSAPPLDDMIGGPPPAYPSAVLNAPSDFSSRAEIKPDPVATTPGAESELTDPFANLRLNDAGRRNRRKTAQKQASILESLSAVKRLCIPSDLPWVFLRQVEPNTSKNIETCAFLLGKLSPNDDFIVTELYIPPQSGTADTVNVGSEGDEATLTYAISSSLCILGWIHTHPSQACFLSSVDLHTQFIYQATQGSFIGIVMAPSYPKNNVGFFSITEKGLSILRNCSKDGFHQHSENEGLYAASNHVFLDDMRKTKVVDAR